VELEPGEERVLPAAVAEVLHTGGYLVVLGTAVAEATG